MKPFRVGRWLCALVVIAGGAAPVHAAWDNVFQVCCNHCRSQPSRYYASRYSCCAPPVACCPQPCCTTQYVQRSYYTPVTTYQTQTYYEPVTSYRTSYYYEPVTSYRYSCYYDPCTCSYQQVACPTTCYRLRSQTCATTSYLERTCCVPVTSYRLSCYYEPVTTCVTPAPCPTPCSNVAPAPAAVVPATPGVSEQAAPAPAPATPGIYEQRTPQPSTQQQYYPPPTAAPPSTPPAQGTGNSYRQVPPAQPQASPPPTVKLDRIVAVPKSEAGSVQGQVVQQDNLPRAGAQLTFVRADQQDMRQPVTADQAGNFQARLASGGWLVYLTSSDGKPVYHSQIEVKGDAPRQVILVSR